MKATTLLRLGFYGLLVGAAAATYVQMPEIRRYLKMRAM